MALTDEDKQLSYGWLRFRPTWLQFLNTPKWFFFFLMQYFFTQSIGLNGIYSGSISTIEKRFGFSSYMMGMVTSTSDIAAMILTPLISYIGGSRKKPVFCAWGLFTTGVGFLIFMLPHFLSPTYQAGVITASTLNVSASDSGLCAANRTDFGEVCEEEAAGGDTLYYAMFIVGMIAVGAGAAPMYALGIPYVDENVSPKVMPIYVGLFMASGIAGASIGFVLLAQFLAMFVEPGVQTSLTVNDSGWVGNWWIGFAIFGAVCVFWSFWLLGFPKKFPLTKKQRETDLCEGKPGAIELKDQEETEEVKEEEEVSYSSLKDLPKATKLVFTRLPFVFVTLGACLESFFLSCSLTFMAKIIHVQFYVPPGEAALLYGVIGIPCAFLGNMLGSYINKRLKLNMTGSAKMCVIVVVLGLVASCFLYIKCDTQNIAGVNSPYLNSPDPLQLSSPCNQACNCTEVSYDPVCGGPLTYFSPCHAGCSQVNTTNKDSYSNCACVAQKDKTSGQAMKGGCQVDCGLNYVFFMIMVGLIPFVTFMTDTPAKIVTLRCIPPNLRAYALGLQIDILRIVGTIPAPIIFGALLDKTCILWSSKCGRKGHCLEYDHDDLALVVVSVFVTCKLIATICFVLSWFFCRRLQSEEETTFTDMSKEGEEGNSWGINGNCLETGEPVKGLRYSDYSPSLYPKFSSAPSV